MRPQQDSETALLRKFVTEQSLPVMTKEEEKAVFTKLRAATTANDEREVKILSDFITRSNLRFCFIVAVRMKSKNMNLRETFSSATVGLNKAIEKFDHRRDVKFMSYAVWWIKQMITVDRAFFDNEVRLPMNVSTEQQTYSRKYKDQIRDGTMPAKHPMTQSYVPLVAHNEEGQEMDVMPAVTASVEVQDHPDLMFRDSDMSNALREAMKDLPEREALILKYTYGLDNHAELTLAELGTKLKITRERVRQLRDAALRKMYAKHFRTTSFHELIGE